MCWRSIKDRLENCAETESNPKIERTKAGEKNANSRSTVVQGLDLSNCRSASLANTMCLRCLPAAQRRRHRWLVPNVHEKIVY